MTRSPAVRRATARVVRKGRSDDKPSLADRAISLGTLALATLGAVWSVIQYTDSLRIQRLGTVLEIHRQYLATFADKLPDLDRTAKILKIRCENYRSAVADGLLPASPPLPRDCEELTATDLNVLKALSGSVSTALRAKIQNDIDVLVPDLDLSLAHRMMIFFRSVQVCVESDLCDSDISGELFLHDMVAFLNASCGHMRDDYRLKQDSLALADHIRSTLSTRPIPWSTDPGRCDLFRCATLRSPACSSTSQPRP